MFGLDLSVLEEIAAALNEIAKKLAKLVEIAERKL